MYCRSDNCRTDNFELNYIDELRWAMIKFKDAIIYHSDSERVHDICLYCYTIYQDRIKVYHVHSYRLQNTWISFQNMNVTYVHNMNRV